MNWKHYDYDEWQHMLVNCYRFFLCFRYVFFFFIFSFIILLSLFMLLAHALNQIFTFYYNLMCCTCARVYVRCPPDPVDLLLICDYYWFYFIFVVVRFIVTRCSMHVAWYWNRNLCVVCTCTCTYFIGNICVNILPYAVVVLCALIGSDLFFSSVY